MNLPRRKRNKYDEMITLADIVKQHQEGIAEEGVDYDDTTFAMCVQLYGLIQHVIQKQAQSELILNHIIQLLQKSRYVWSDATDVAIRPIRNKHK